MDSKSTEIEQTMGLTQTQYQDVANFFFLIYSPNLMKGTVKISIDGTIDMVVTRQQFFNIIKEVCSLTIANQLDYTCSSHGGYYLFDRESKKLRRLNSIEQVEKITSSTLANQRQKIQGGSSLFEKIIQQNPLNIFTQKITSQNHKLNKPTMENRKVFGLF